MTVSMYDMSISRKRYKRETTTTIGPYLFTKWRDARKDKRPSKLAQASLLQNNDSKSHLTYRRVSS